MYANDHQMYVKGREHETVQCRMKTQGQQALSWYSNNFLLANPDKFQSRNINPRKLDMDKSDKTLSINDLEFTNTELIKLLGVHGDENLNFTEHISKLCIKARGGSGGSVEPPKLNVKTYNKRVVKKK